MVVVHMIWKFAILLGRVLSYFESSECNDDIFHLYQQIIPVCQ